MPLSPKYLSFGEYIHQMYEFIYKKAGKQKIGNVAMISDRVVYLWAVTYFMSGIYIFLLQNKEL